MWLIYVNQSYLRLFSNWLYGTPYNSKESNMIKHQLFLKMGSIKNKEYLIPLYIISNNHTFSAVF